jgi:hypothetical protein
VKDINREGGFTTNERGDGISRFGSSYFHDPGGMTMRRVFPDGTREWWDTPDLGAGRRMFSMTRVLRPPGGSDFFAGGMR